MRRPSRFRARGATLLAMERWGIDIAKEYFKFSAAHFLIFPDGSAERLHGHNYRVTVSIEAQLTRFGLVIDFQHIKPVIKALVDELAGTGRWRATHDRSSAPAPSPVSPPTTPARPARW